MAFITEARHVLIKRTFFTACIFMASAYILFLLLSGLSALPSPPPPSQTDNATTTTPDGGSSSSSSSSRQLPKLRLDASASAATFTLAIFSDLHFGEGEHTAWGPAQDANSTRVMRSVLAAEGPRLAVLNGDLVTGEDTLRANASAYVARAVAPLVEGRVPWASTYGNHDSQFNLSRGAVLEAEREAGGGGQDEGALCYTQSMGAAAEDDSGVSNYFLLVYGPENEDDDRPVAVLWFFDSRGGVAFQEDDGLPDWVSAQTVRWFRTASKKLRREHGALPSLAFVHIPPRVFSEAQRGGIDKARFPGVNDDEPLAHQGEGGGGAFAEALKGEEGLHSVYVGHDHGDAWCALWPGEKEEEEDEDGEDEERDDDRRRHGGEHGKAQARGKGPFLCFSKHTGYGGYGEWKRGARMVKLAFHDGGDGGDEGGGMDVSTWVRMEDGRVVTKVALNSTYGEDRYPADDGE